MVNCVQRKRLLSCDTYLTLTEFCNKSLFLLIYLVSSIGYWEEIMIFCNIIKNLWFPSSACERSCMALCVTATAQSREHRFCTEQGVPTGTSAILATVMPSHLADLLHGLQPFLKGFERFISCSCWDQRAENMLYIQKVGSVTK